MESKNEFYEINLDYNDYYPDTSIRGQRRSFGEISRHRAPARYVEPGYRNPDRGRHSMQDNLAWNISIGGMLANVDVTTNFTGTSTEAAFVVPILFGVKYYIARSTFDTSVRPFAKAAVGPFIGQQEKSEENIAGTIVETRSETAFGGQLGGGVDFLISRHFMTGFALGYNLISDFDQPIGGSRNYSGPVFDFGLSVLF